MIRDLMIFRMETCVYSDIVHIVLEFEILNHREKGLCLIRHIWYFGIDEFQMFNESMSRPRRPFFSSVIFGSVMEIEAFLGVSNDLYVFVVIMKLRNEVSNTLLNHLSLRVVTEEDCI